MAQSDLVIGHHRSLHPRSAHLVQRGRGHLFAQTGGKACLPRRSLPLPRRQNAAHQNLIHRLRARALQCGSNGRSAQFSSGDAVEHALKPTHRGACCPGDYDLFHENSSSFPGLWIPNGKDSRLAYFYQCFSKDRRA